MRPTWVLLFMFAQNMILQESQYFNYIQFFHGKSKFNYKIVYCMQFFQNANSTEKGGRKNSTTPGSGSGTKRKSGKNGEKAERDPNAPKRPANPFFQFCQEQRPIVMERIGLEQKSGEAEPSKQELTRQLASKWNKLPPEDKKVKRF